MSKQKSTIDIECDIYDVFLLLRKLGVDFEVIPYTGDWYGWQSRIRDSGWRDTINKWRDDGGL